MKKDPRSSDSSALFCPEKVFSENTYSVEIGIKLELAKQSNVIFIMSNKNAIIFIRSAVIAINVPHLACLTRVPRAPHARVTRVKQAKYGTSIIYRSIIPVEHTKRSCSNDNSIH